ncbi:MAG: hypothetical protein WCK51_14335 [Armatimonadota bacterium]
MRTKIVIWLFVIVLLSVAVVQSGRYSFDLDHGLEKTGSNGTAAFAALVTESFPGTKITDKVPKDKPLIVIPFTEEYKRDLRDFFRKDAPGGTYVLFQITRFTDEKAKTPVSVVNTATGASLGQLTGYSNEWSSSWSDIFGEGDGSSPVKSWSPTFLKEPDEFDVISAGSELGTVATMQHAGDKTIYYFEQASHITNGHLAEANNADIFLGFIQSANTQKRPITILNTYLNAANQQGLVERLGPLFHSAWNQFLVLLAVVFLTLNIRFGKTPEPRAEQRSGRELVDGVGNFARRKDLGRWAVQCVYNQTMIELERRHRTSRQQLLNRPEDFLTQNQAIALIEAQASLSKDLSAKDALNVSRRLRRLV